MYFLYYLTIILVIIIITMKMFLDNVFCENLVLGKHLVSGTNV